METDIRYYRRRACEEMSAASRAVTPAARERRLHLVGIYLDRLRAMNAPSPFDHDMMAGLPVAGGPAERPAFAWPGTKSAEQA